jgi:hypothetical protein
LLILSAASCASSDSADANRIDTTAQSKSDSEDNTVKPLSDGLPEKNMNGFTLNILHTTIDWATVQLDAEMENGDLINDAIYKRNIKIEDRFNCKINIREDAFSNVSTTYRNQVAAGDTENDIFMVYGIDVAGLVDNIADFNNLPYINLDAAWWNPNATSIFNIGTKQIAAAGNFSLSYVSTANCLLFNKRIFRI